jgi:hypothetical protein
MDLLGYVFIQNRFSTLLAVSLVGGLCWSHTQASKPLVIVKNTLELTKFTILMQCYDNENAVGGFILDVFIQNRLRFTLPFFARFARTLPGSTHAW